MGLFPVFISCQNVRGEEDLNMRFDSAIPSERDIRKFQLSCFDICSTSYISSRLIAVMEEIYEGGGLGTQSTKHFNEKVTANLFWLLRFGMN